MKQIKKTNEEFIISAKLIHGEKYDYSLVDYKTAKDKIKIICDRHGVFEQSPDSHVNKKSNCPKCVNNVNLTTNEFIKKSKKIHTNKYDYSLVNYTNNKSKVKIICQKHGLFEVKAGNHLRGDNCSACTNNKKLTTDIFIKKVSIIHN